MTGIEVGPDIRYHFIITLQWEGANSPPMASTTGTIMIPPGKTRQDAYNWVRDLALAKNADRAPAAEPVTTFFSLEPDELPVPPPGGRKDGDLRGHDGQPGLEWEAGR